MAGGDMPSHEQRLSDFYARFVDSDVASVRYFLRHPVLSLRAVALVARLPRLRAELPQTVDGRAIHRTLTRPGPFGTPVGASGVAVLEVPADPAEYSLGAHRQTLRRKVRAALKAGVTCRPIDDPAERYRLLALANAAETRHADDQYRNEQPDNSDLLEHGLWLAAFDAEGTPLLLSVTPAEGAWGQLRYFRTLGSSPQHSDSRYLMTQVLVEHLSARGARYLVEGTHPAELPNGLRHFQRMVGFRLVRVTARRQGTPPPGGTAAERRSESRSLVAISG